MMKNEKLNIFEKTVESIGWIQIFLSPFIIGVIISAIIYFSNPNNLTFFFAIIILAVGVVTGIKLATKIKKNQGTINFLSKTASTPEPDNNKKIQNDTR